MIDVSFDFTSDSDGYWDGYWDRNGGLGSGGSDPDIASPTLRTYHQLLWSKELPNGQMMKLKQGQDARYDYMTWNNMRFGSDSIIVSFRYQKYRYMIERVFEKVGDYKSFFEDYTRKAYTIGGSIIFPKHRSSMNQNKGTIRTISDRWDLTLECIRRYYRREKSPLYDTMVKDKEFFDLFVNFQGYVDFFFLQDAVSKDYSKVNTWCGKSDFDVDGLPKTIDEYFDFIEKELAFLAKRNQRIEKYCNDIEA